MYCPHGFKQIIGPRLLRPAIQVMLLTRIDNGPIKGYETCVVWSISRTWNAIMADSSTVDALRKRIAELEESLERQARMQDALRGTRFSPGVSFFDLLSLELAHASGAEIAFVGTLLPGQRQIRTVGLCLDG